MVLTQKLFDDLAEKYGMCSSWAVWNPDNPIDTQIISANLTHLNTSVIMVALNVSGQISHTWSNFHGGRHPKKLMNTFNDSTYRGAYMTDIIKDEIEVNSTILMERIKRGEIDVRAHINAFRAEMDFLGIHRHALFILFGDKAKYLFSTYLGDIYPNYVRCTHYSYYGVSDELWRSDVQETLEKHYDDTRSKFNTLKFAQTI